MFLEQEISFVKTRNTGKVYKGNKFHYNGFSLIVVVPSFVGYKERAREEVCKANCLKVGRMYDAYLILEGMEGMEGMGHSEVVFDQYLQECGGNICPECGEISYVDGKVWCSVHSWDEDRDSDEDGIPYL